MTKKIETQDEIRAREMIEGIASNIAQLSRQVSNLMSGRLKKKSLVILLAQSARMSQTQVEQVLNAIVNLERDHLN